jgi:hypothetical protein
MGVAGLHQYVRQRAEDKHQNVNVGSYLKVQQSKRDKTRVIIDGNNFAFSILKESHTPGTKITKLGYKLFNTFQHKTLFDI